MFQDPINFFRGVIIALHKHSFIYSLNSIIFIYSLNSIIFIYSINSLIFIYTLNSLIFIYSLNSIIFIFTLNSNIFIYTLNSIIFIYTLNSVKIKWITKETCLKPILLIHSSFLIPSFFGREDKKGERITSFRIFSDPIDFHTKFNNFYFYLFNNKVFNLYKKT